MNEKRKARLGTAGVVAAGAVLLLVLSACAKSTTPSSGGAATAAAQTSGGLTVSTTQVSGVGTALVDPNGAVLYYLATEKPGSIMCTGSCAALWPPLVLPSGTTSASAGSGVTGKLGTIQRPDGGTQVTYNGKPLYTFVSDKNPGDATGQGVQHFFVAVASGSGNSGGGNSGSGNSKGGGGGGYGY
jgi:predicted lipoprotein with Yx(FWY)xxD motif